MISDYLTTDEHLQLMKAGALMHAACRDANLAYDGIEKTAWLNPMSVAEGAARTAKAGTDAALSTLFLTALGLGVPLGALWHVGDKRITSNRVNEQALREKIRLYQEAADEMASELKRGN